MRMIQITDLHLSDQSGSPAEDALRWSIDETNRVAPDLVAFTGDMTTYGTAKSAERFLDQARRLTVPWVFTPGNAELRTDGATSVLAEHTEQKSTVVKGVRFLLPDTSRGAITSGDRAWLEDEGREKPFVILTHYPTDVLDGDSRVWLGSWASGRPLELYLAGHRHFTRSRTVESFHEVTTRGLDPDKAFGGPPGISQFSRRDGVWSEEPISWPHGNDLLPAETAFSPVGWSIHGDPLDAVRETRAAGYRVLELRPRTSDYDVPSLVNELNRMREMAPTYLSWHLPSLSWDDEGRRVTGREAVEVQVEHARACGVDAFTIHVPQLRADQMLGGDRSEPWSHFVEAFTSLFGDAVSEGARVSIENVHNAPGTPILPTERNFATEIGEYLSWIDAVASGMGEYGSRVGAHFDVGHARNNGELGNYQPLGDWYARVGPRITGYHIHQVRPHEETGKLTNHRDIVSIYDRTISYAGFLHAWSNGLIRRAPLFVEVRDPEERRRTASVLQDVFPASTGASRRH